MGTVLSPQLELFVGRSRRGQLASAKDVAIVEGIRHQTWRLAAEAERTEVQRELQELQEEAKGHHKEDRKSVV